MLVNGELAAQVRVVQGKLTVFMTRVKSSQNNTIIAARVIANGSELDSASRNVAVNIPADRPGGSPISVGLMKVQTQNGVMKMLMNSENGFAGTLVLQATGFRAEISGSSVISKNPFIGVNGEFPDQLTASIDGKTQLAVPVTAKPEIAQPAAQPGGIGAGYDPRAARGK